MALYFADDAEQMSFGVQASNVSEVAQFSSTLDNVMVRMFTNNGLVEDNLVTGVAIGSSNYDKTSTASNNLYIGHISGSSNIDPVFLMQDGKIAINTVPYSNFSLTVNDGAWANEIATPFLVAQNVDEIFYNIAARTYVNKAFITTGTPSPSGGVTLALDIKGNSTSYAYRLEFTNNDNGSKLLTGIQNTSSSTPTYTSNYTTGTYNIGVSVSTPGTGAGSTCFASNLATLVIGATDSIGSPSVSLASLPTFDTNSLTYVSGVPYYTSGTSVSFAQNALNFGNIYDTVDPFPTYVTDVLTLNSTNFSYASVFTDYKNSSFNTANSVATPLAITLTGYGAETVSISGTVRNVNYTSGTNTVLLSGIAYLGTTVNETTLDMVSVATYTVMPITSIRRMSIPTSEANPLIPPVDNLVAYDGSTPSAYDSLYSPYTRRFYTTSSAVSASGVRGLYAPSFSSLGIDRFYLTMKIVTTAALTSFVLSLTNSTNIDDVYVSWQSVNSGSWYSAKDMFNNGGCASASYPSEASGTRFPITLPQGQTLTSATNIFINIKFGQASTGTVSLPGIVVSYS